MCTVLFSSSRDVLAHDVGLLRDSQRLYLSEQTHKLQRIVEKPHGRPKWEISETEQVSK